MLKKLSALALAAALTAGLLSTAAVAAEEGANTIWYRQGTNCGALEESLIPAGGESFYSEVRVFESGDVLILPDNFYVIPDGYLFRGWSDRASGFAASFTQPGETVGISDGDAFYAWMTKPYRSAVIYVDVNNDS